MQLARLLRPWRRQLLLTAAAVIVSTAASLVPPYVAAKAIDDGIVKGDVGRSTRRSSCSGGGGRLLADGDGADLRLGVDLPARAGEPAPAIFATSRCCRRASTTAPDRRPRLAPHQRRRAAREPRRGGLGHVGSVLALVGTLVAMFVLDAELALVALWVFPASLRA